MLYWQDDGVGGSLLDSHRRRRSCYSIFPAFCQDWREQERQPRFHAFTFRIVNRSRRLTEEHPSPGFRGPAAGVGGIDPNPVVVDENVPEHQRLDLRHTETVGGNPVDQFLLQRREEALHPGVVVTVGHAAQTLRQSLPGKLRAERLAGVLAPAVAVQDGIPYGEPTCHGFDGVDAQLLLHVVPHFQRENLAAIAVHDRGDVQLAIPALHLGDIRQ